MDDDLLAALAALTDEDRQWLTEQGWRDTSNDYPTIGTEDRWTI